MALKTASTGAFLIPTAPAVGATVTGGAANTFTTNAVQLIASTGAAIYITGIYLNLSSTSKPTYVVVRLSTGAADGSIVGEYVVPYAYTAGATGTVMAGYVALNPWIPVATSTRIGCKTADSVGSLGHTVILQCINQSNVVDAGIVEQADVQTIKTNAVVNGGTITFPTNATLASTTNITAATGITLTATTGMGNQTANITGTITTATNLTTNNDKTGYSLAAGQKVDVDTIKTNPVVNAGTVTFPTNATLASTTNITSATGITAATVSDKTGYSLTATTGLGNQTANITGNLSGSVGSVTGGVTVTTNNDKTGYALTTAYDKAKTAAQDSDAVDILSKTNPLTFDSDNFVLSHPMTSISATVDSDVRALIAGDVWSEALPGAYTLGKAGYTLNAVKTQTDKLTYDSDNFVEAHTMNNVTVGTNNDKTGYTVSTVSDKTGYALTAAYDAAKTASQDSDMQTALTDLGSLPTATQNADELLKRDWTSVTGEASRSVLNALRFIRNKFSTIASAGFVTVYKEDDTAIAYTKSLSTDSDAEPIVVG
jgi:hypothetical protein